MELEQLMQLIDAVSGSKLTEFRYEENGVKLCLKKESSVSGPAAGSLAAVPVSAAGMTPVSETVQAAGTAYMAGAANVPGALQTSGTAYMAGTANMSETVNTTASGIMQTAPGAPSAAVHVTAEAAVLQPNVEKTDGNIVKSPLVGVFYAAPAEDAKPYVAVGDTVKKGQVLACVEAMKLMNEIESEFDGIVAEILVENGQGVGYGEPLFVIR